MTMVGCLRERLWKDLDEHCWHEGERHVDWSTALQKWVNQHYIHFIRYRWLEHVTGRIKWDLLDDDKYDILNFENHYQNPSLACNLLLKELEKDLENANIVFEHGDKPGILALLLRLDINNWRLSFYSVAGISPESAPMVLDRRLSLYTRVV